MNNIQRFIDATETGDKAVAGTAFNTLMTDKIKVMLDIKKIELASEIYDRSSNRKINESRSFESFSDKNLILWLQTNWTTKNVTPEFRDDITAAVDEAKKRGLSKVIKKIKEDLS